MIVLVVLWRVAVLLAAGVGFAALGLAVILLLYGSLVGPQGLPDYYEDDYYE